MVLMRLPRPWALTMGGLLAALMLCVAMSGPARARVFIGFGLPLFLPPVYVAPPVYYPPYYGPPAGYAPPGNTFSYASPSSQPQNLAPPAGYGPPGYGPPGYGPPPGYAPGGYAPSGGSAPSESADAGAPSCRAGAYVCPLVADTPPGGACSCPGQDGRRVRGRAN